MIAPTQLDLLAPPAAAADELYAITLTQPWASLAVLLEKRWETRGWKTSRRGRVAIHAALGFPDQAKDLCAHPIFRSVLARHGIHGPEDLPTGKIIGVCDILSCEPTATVVSKISGQEQAFGDYTPGRYAFELGAMFRLPMPVAASGKLSFWRVLPAQARAVLDQLPKP